MTARDHGEAIGLLRQLAAARPGQPFEAAPSGKDGGLFDLCERVLWHASQIEGLRAESYGLPLFGFAAKRRSIRDAMRPHELSITCCVRRLRGMPASSPPEIFAKALAIRATPSGAPRLAASLAQDLIDSPALRAAVWPATVQQ